MRCGHTIVEEEEGSLLFLHNLTVLTIALTKHCARNLLGRRAALGPLLLRQFFGHMSVPVNMGRITKEIVVSLAEGRSEIGNLNLNFTLKMNKFPFVL